MNPVPKQLSTTSAPNGTSGARPPRTPIDPPSYRKLRVYTYDPSTKTQLETALINETTLRIPWEGQKPGSDGTCVEQLKKGPVGDYLEVIDYDPASRCFYEPVDLNDPAILARDGLDPSEGNPKFHQQMIYAVAMATIDNFEKALGRKVLWANHMERDKNTREVKQSQAISRLRVYPHALREANAFYSPDKKALLFGYFPASLTESGENLPGGLVFTCLSHDVIAHETTHAILDGVHRYFAEPSNPDVLAFHEAFADVVALLQHFTQTEALRHQIAKTRGDLRSDNLLAELAHQFGEAIGNHGALRNAIGSRNKKGEWVPAMPSAEDYEESTEPHKRGSVLVAAIFDAFLAIYDTRTSDLIRIATNGTGRLPEGHIQTDLVRRLAREAARTASHLLRMAIRALDYCPPVDITFGEYLRALVTADFDLVPEDAIGYRTAVIEGFRRRGIYARDVRVLADDALRWQKPRPGTMLDFSELLIQIKESPLSLEDSDGPLSRLSTLSFQTTGERADIARLNRRAQYITHEWITHHLAKIERCSAYGDQINNSKTEASYASALGLALSPSTPVSVYRNSSGVPTLEVHSVRAAHRPSQDGRTITDVVIEMTQRRRGYLTEARQIAADALPWDSAKFQSEFKPDFRLRGGCTLLINGETGEVRYCIVKDILSPTRLARQREFSSGRSTGSLRATYVNLRGAPDANQREPFAMLHRGE